MYEIIYYESFSENPVIDFISNQYPKEQAKILREIDLLQTFGISLGMPHLRKIKNTELWELRIIHGNNIFRILFKDLDKSTYLLLHGFQKKQDKTPKKEIDIALKRLKEYLEGGDR
ncbi:type II toxin-antitoxin system RelE/ParE family toxin [Natranaerofaba carboxydovora]|uniref:type II toxin-antitoxin system RelE/ParE family toxin n=1 Tax=Natranaerofaba carboxydovora TaxID=2742683 RepID=UPI001F141BB5|nr:type II toxin-antitoxin system RelE/ParE family toxin [Natranaerofaba carboxydovora]UMZ74745.1 hypothetical protein ACONDI_02347 [Natranaerofaba carboxydovora]